ncbi:DUF2141 domain-containing protein [Spirosoma sp. KUDC1026]|uniref:DUF2141 domain-containing protein n=1 Tax=Spirosoma sp. KUDC1026 TaxID=2745947 RepID=UPI00159BD05F|nr:DUF2141 domain-containing protein [Spirosoma sp. KUDC1026]QKZ12353.1 DUF2141 domain-containing protein [Spirosoma sp. KUDC1026]
MLILLSLLSLFIDTPHSTPVAPKVTLSVEVQDIQSKEGTVFVALFKPGKDFPEGTPFEGKKSAVGGKSALVTFSVEPGNYAVAVYHDENNNGKMDKRMFGIPKEPYGFSQNFRPTVAAPKFSDCQFTVGQADKKISIQIK